MQHVTIPDEFALLAACCRWPLTSDAIAEIQRRAGGAIDWDFAARLIERHRVAGLVHHALYAAGVSVPAGIWSGLAARSQAIARQNLALATESVRLQRRLEAAGIPVVGLKGLSLAQRVYGDIALKHGRDIDVLVPPEHAFAALRLLEEDGYALVDPASEMSGRQRHAFIARGHELEVGRDRGAPVELHWRLSENPHLTRGLDPFSAKQDVQLSAGGVRTLDDAALFCYLCVHGANHFWFRLKWLADLNALLGALIDDEIEGLYRRAQAHGAGLCAAQALVLCDRIFGRRPPADLAHEFHADRRVARLVAVAMDRLLAGDAAAVPERDRERLPQAASRFLLGRGVRFIAAQAGIMLVAPADVLLSPLPRPLWFLYPLIRLPSWAARRMMRRSPAIRPAKQSSGATGRLSSDPGGKTVARN
jgi:hypothetical protein